MLTWSASPYYSLLQSTTSALLRLTIVLLLYYSVLQSTTKYCSVLQSTTPVLQRTTPVLQSTSPVLLCTTTTRHLQCAEKQKSLSNCLTSPNITPATKSYPHHWSLSHITSFTMRRDTGITLQPHQIMRLPRKVTLIIDPCHKWNAIYTAQSNRCHCPTSPNTAPATKSYPHHWSLSHMKRHLQ